MGKPKEKKRLEKSLKVSGKKSYEKIERNFGDETNH